MLKQTACSQKENWYTVLICSLMGCSISAAFPQFSMTVTALSHATGLSEEFLLTGDTIKSVFIVAAMLISGFMYKRFGAKKNLAIALLCTAAPQFLLPYSSNPLLFMVLKSIQGFASVIFPIFLLVIMDAVSRQQAGLATAVFNGIFYSGGGIGGTVAGIFISRYGWISSYFSLGIIEIVIGIIWLITVKDIQGVDKKLDEPSSTNSVSILSLLKRPLVWLLILAFISSTFVIQAITVDLPLFSQWLGYKETETGTVTTVVTFGLLLSCLSSGKISDLFAQKASDKARARILVMAIGPGMIIAASFILILADLSSLTLFSIAAFLFSFGGSWGLGAFYSILPELFDSSALPAVTGLAGGAGDLGMPAAPFLVGVIFGSKGLWSLGWSMCIAIACISLSSCILLCTVRRK